jgi:hypothetical protein
MNLGALIPLLKLAQDLELLDDKTTTTIFEPITPKKFEPGTITVNLEPGVVSSYVERERARKLLRKI